MAAAFPPSSGCFEVLKWTWQQHAVQTSRLCSWKLFKASQMQSGPQSQLKEGSLSSTGALFHSRCQKEPSILEPCKPTHGEPWQSPKYSETAYRNVRCASHLEPCLLPTHGVLWWFWSREGQSVRTIPRFFPLPGLIPWTLSAAASLENPIEINVGIEHREPRGWVSWLSKRKLKPLYPMTFSAVRALQWLHLLEWKKIKLLESWNCIVSFRHETRIIYHSDGYTVGAQ